MPKIKKMPKRRQNRRSNFNPSPSQVKYRGPTRLPSSGAQNDLMTTQINNTGQIATSASGVVNTVFDAFLQMSTPTDWTNLSGLYTEFRILSMEVEAIPWNTYNMPTTNVLTPVYAVADRNSGSTLSTSAQAVAYDSVKSIQPSKRWKKIIKMDSIEEAQWTAVGATPPTASRLYIKLYSSGNSNSITLYDFVVRVIVQLRGRQ